MTLKAMPKSIPNLLALLLLAVTPIAYGDPREEATITVVDEAATPDDVVKVIELPVRAATAARTAPNNASNAGSGKDNAHGGNDKSAGGSDNPAGVTDNAGSGSAGGSQDKADASGRDFGQQVADEARNKDLKELAKEDAKQQGKKDSRNDNGGGNRHGPSH